MADNDAGQQPQDDGGEPPRTTLEEHERTYERFLGLTKWAVAVVALVLIGMALFLL
jgi:hypothetical protein